MCDVAISEIVGTHCRLRALVNRSCSYGKHLLRMRSKHLAEYLRVVR
jgi:hypothetical protein